MDEACRKHEISLPIYNQWKAKYVGMGIKETQRLGDLEKENSELKKLLALLQGAIEEHGAPDISALTTAQDLLLRLSSSGLWIMTLKRSTSIPAAHG